MRSVLGTADAEPSHAKGIHRDKGYLEHILMSVLGAADAELSGNTYQYGASHFYQRSVLGAANAEPSQARDTKFLEPEHITQVGNRNIRTSSDSEDAVTRQGRVILCTILNTAIFPRFSAFFSKERSAGWRYFRVFIDQGRPDHQLCLLLPRPGDRRSSNQ